MVMMMMTVTFLSQSAAEAARTGMRHSTLNLAVGFKTKHVRNQNVFLFKQVLYGWCGNMLLLPVAVFVAVDSPVRSGHTLVFAAF